MNILSTKSSKRYYIMLVISLILLSITSQFKLYAKESLDGKMMRTVEVVGYGSASKRADEAKIYIGVTHVADSAKESMKQTSQAMKNIFSVLDELKIANDDRQTQNISLYPTQERVDCLDGGICNNNEPMYKRVYRSSNNIIVRVRKLDSLGSVLDKLTQSGANTIDNIQFDIASKEELEAEAQQKAIKHARKRAMEYAKESGLVLGNVLSIKEKIAQENIQPSIAMSASLRADESFSVPIAGGKLSVSTEVIVIFQLHSK